MRFPAALTAGQVAHLVGGELVGPADVRLVGVAALEVAGPGDLACLWDARAARQLPAVRADAVLLASSLRESPGGPSSRIVVDDPIAALERIALALAPAAPNTAPGIAGTARIGRGTQWEGRLTVHAYAVIGRDVRLGADCVIGAHAVVEDGVTAGTACRIGEHVVVHRGITLGHRVVLAPGARVGGRGFGFLRGDPAGARIPHLGGCQIGDDVEIGANAAVDRGTVGDTVIGPGTKIDNLVQVAHNVRIGAKCVVMAQVGIAGSTVVEDEVLLAGQAGLADHLRVGRGARVGAQSGVIGDVPPGATVSGYPARDHRTVLRQASALRRLTPIINALERQGTRDD